MKNQFKLFALLPLCFLIGCDPGLIRQPSGWIPNNAGFYTLLDSDLSIGVTPIRGLVGQSYINIRVNIRNNSSLPTTIDQITIRTEKGQYIADYANQPVTIEPYSNFMSYIGFDFGKALFEVFEGGAELEFTFARAGKTFVVGTNLVKGI